MLRITFSRAGRGAGGTMGGAAAYVEPSVQDGGDKGGGERAHTTAFEEWLRWAVLVRGCRGDWV